MSFLRRLSWAALALAAACDSKKPEPTPPPDTTVSKVQAAAAQPLTQETPVPDDERFAAVYSDAEIAAAVGATPPELSAAQMAAITLAMDAEIAQAPQYQPSSTLPPDAPPGMPVGQSFTADLKSLHQRTLQAFGSSTLLLCTFPPCTLRGDIDGDGLQDLVGQIASSGDLKMGVVFALGNNTQQKLAAGTASSVGDDLSWVSAWSLETRTEPSQSGGTPVTTTILHLQGKNDDNQPQAAKAYFTRTTPGGPSQMKTDWEQPQAQ
ncbi:hypothetical protein MYSTI_02204 [Myxococcus stipitatus DSM 14675]|uniref:Lipoprotein n=1 Tax=Myxococcus stipitatus (strain DSM 14675 / JCM 12634 / Mx s8) TaxID=1278073 RepID=L7U431_MYXSD|nr:hypothetical protein [Myxococcus stipitatus]AGC43531.1 hypothetical protein MYSTI_02204 [Myxococcus stipitatus DSM 14675]